MNKTELVEAVAVDVGDRKVAEQAVASVLNAVMRTVAGGEKVTISGFGTWERRTRAARTARNPATSAKIKLKATHVVGFKTGTQFKEVAAAGKMPKVANAVKAAVKAVPVKRAFVAKAAPVKKAAATKAAPAKTTRARSK